MDDNVQRLYQAIENSDEQLIRSLIENGVNLRARNDRGMSSLHLAVERSSREIVDQLLKADLSLVDDVVVSSERESCDIVGYTALHFSAKRTDTEIALTLLRSGAKHDVVDRNLRTPLHVAVLHENKDGVKVMLRRNASVNAEDCQGKTAFMYAVECDHVDIVKLFLRKANEEMCKSYAEAIIEIASDSRCIEFVQSLQCHDIFVKVMMFTLLNDEMLIEILKCAIEKRRINVIDNSLSSMNISLDNTRTIATVDSANETNVKVAQLLMNYNYNVKFVDLEAALHIAVVNNYNDILNTYLQEGVNVDSKDVNGNSLLYMTCLEKNLDATKKCIALGCDVHAKNSSGDTVLHAAVRNVRHVDPELFVLLKESGCDLNAKNNNLETPFQLFLKNLNYDVQNGNLSNVMVVAKMFLTSGMDLSCHENGNECVLHLAVSTGVVELVKLVIKYHPSLEHLDKEKEQTCFHLAAEFNCIDVVKFLLELGANPDVRDIDGELPITIAIHEEHEEMVKLLVNYSNLNAYRNLETNRTVMHLATATNNEEIISALVCAGVDLHAKDISEGTAICNSYYMPREPISQHLLNVGFDVNFGCHKSSDTCSCWSKFYTKEFVKIHVLKLHLIEYDLQPFLLSLIDNAEVEFQNVYSDISEEAKRLKTARIPDTIIPFTDIIKLDDKKLANYARNESVVKVFKDVDSLKIKWPHYSEILIARMMKGFVRRRLLDKCYVIFDTVVNTDSKLLDECVEFIFDKLETCELHTFIVSFPSVDTSGYDDFWFILNTLAPRQRFDDLEFNQLLVDMENCMFDLDYLI